jgi:hypothetical protein
MIRKYISALVILLMLSGAAWGQNSRIMYFMNLPQNHYLNPALQPSDTVYPVYIGLPGMSGLSVSANNNFLNFSDVFEKGHSDSLITFLHSDFNKDRFLSMIRKNNSIEPDFTVPLFGLGFRAGKSYIFFDVNEKIESNLVFPGELVELMINGNEGFVGDRIDLSALRGDMRLYHEIGLGFSRNYTDRFRFGIKGKVLIGVATASIHSNSLGISIGNDYSHSMDADVDVNISAPVTIVRDRNDDITDIRFDDDKLLNSVIMRNNGVNPGFAIDMGATYQLTKRLKLSAAVTDLGFIKWKTNVTNLRINQNFEFNGVDVSNVMNGDKTFDEVTDDLLDSLQNSYTIGESYNPFSTMLPTNINLAGEYHLTKGFSMGVLSSSRFIGKQIRESLTMSANLNLGTIFATSLSYTATNHRYDNFGAGVSMRLGWFQLYMMSDRIPVMWNRILTDNNNDRYGNEPGSIVVPSYWNTIDFRMGMNMVFGYHRAKVRARKGLN